MPPSTPAHSSESTSAELFESIVDSTALQELIERARIEDLRTTGDVTSAVCIPETLTATAHFRARSRGRLCGGILLQQIASTYNEALQVTNILEDGSTLSPRQVIADIAGPLHAIVTAERVMLNFLTHLSGIATLTHQYVQAVAHTHAKIYDTRKTIPGMRDLAKYAVHCGDGHCHRIGLFDAVLIKDNHIAHIPTENLNEAIQEIIERASSHAPRPEFIEIEVDTPEQFEQTLGTPVDIVLLDNMAPELLKEAVQLRDQADSPIQLEASGGVDLASVVAIAETGVDRIAIGALTHSAPALDIGLDLIAQ